MQGLKEKAQVFTLVSNFEQQKHNEMQQGIVKPIKKHIEAMEKKFDTKFEEMKEHFNMTINNVKKDIVNAVKNELKPDEEKKKWVEEEKDSFWKN